MSTDPDRLRREIEQTQRTLGSDVDALAEKVTPSRIMHRRVDRARGALLSAKDSIMGSDHTSAPGGAHSAMASVSDTASSVADSATSAARSATDTLQEAPQAIRRGTRGNPLAAGLIALGAGWLAASLLPASKAEQRLAGQVKDGVQQVAGPVADTLGSVAQDVRDTLREPAQQAVESVRSTASDGASAVADEAKSAAHDVRGEAQDARHAVQDHARS